MSSVHPHKEQLIAFGQGKLAADESSSVEQHLEVCRECCETLLDLKDDTFVGLVRIAKPDDAVADAASVRTDPGADASRVSHDSEHAATLLVQSGEAVSVDELPVELLDHPRYRIVELIGRGGMGNVYRAEHRLMNRPVAIKLINSQLIRQPQAVERFRREVQAAAKLAHPNIVTAYDAEQAGDVHFLVMEFVEGTDLASVVKHRGPMSVAEACECIRQAAEGLQHAHERGMVHRDIKPHNLMLSAEGQVRILDFGLAGFASESTADSISRNALASGSDTENADTDKPDASAFRLISAAHLTTAGSVMGTPDYIAPEQVQDAHSADIRADIYSLGCTLHFLLTGKPPFEADNVLAKLKAHANEPPPSLAVLREDVPADLSKVAARMLAKNPAERFQTPAEVVAALEPFTKTTTTRQQRVRRRIAAAVLGFLVLLAGVIVVATARGRLEIHSEVDDVKVIVKQGGEQVDVFDLKTGLQIKWLPGGDYELELVGQSNDVKLDKTGFQLSRWGKEVVRAKLVPREIAATDRDRLQGTWLAESGQRNGAATPAEQIGMQRAVFAGDKVHVDMPGGLTGDGLVQLVESTKPKQIWLQVEGQNKGMRGIYKLDGDRLTLCMDQDPAGKLPTDFVAKAGSTVDVIVLRRVTVAANVPDEQRLQGKWIAVSGHARKKPLTAAELAQLSITFDGERVEFVQPSGPPTPQAVTFTINSNRDPKQIDFVAPGKQESMPGIYQFDGDRLKLALIDQDYSRPTNFDPDHRPDHLTATFERVTVAATLGDEERKVLKAAEAFLAVADNDKFDQLRDISSALAKSAATKEQATKQYQLLRDTVGKATQRTLRRLWLIGELPGLPAGRYAAVEYKTKFAKREGLMFESAVLNVDTDGQWRVNTYATSLEPLPIPGSKTKPAPSAVITMPPPSAPTSPAAFPVGFNLIHDPSFEATAPTLLPRGWSSWLNDGQDFRCEVIAGGRTGQRSLHITGKGTRGVVFANSVVVDRSKRFALKGWAKFEGDKDARAIIKFNYFHNGKWLGVNDLIGVKADQPGWHLLEKTDALDAHPEATTLVATCHVEGNGSGWFDDLELIAFDRDKLPAAFETRHGRHNRLTGPLSLERWVGAWETQYVFRESDNSPQETKLTMKTAAERTLGDFFLMSHAKATVGDEERLLFLTFDQNVGAFRQWFFSSNGKVFESRGQWDDSTKSLELRMLPDASRLTSTERFVDADHIEATMRQPFLMSIKEAGRWTATRQAATAKVDVPVANAPVAEPAELSLLNKFAGEWTIRATHKPSVWNPQQREETFSEKSTWILGGRFLMTRAFNDKGEVTSIWLATYEPSEKSNRFWFFNADGSSGQWRLTWDAASRGFHFRSIDMPAGWIGTGFNRWINDDTFDNQALIKDEQGRVLLDTTQDKRRKK